MTDKFSNLISGPIPTLVDFYADWCGPCKMMKPVLEELKSRLGDKVRIIKIDVDRNPALAQQYQVQGVPTLIVFKNGKIHWRQSGVVMAAELERVVGSLG
jgi:thioredoxin 1